MGSNSEFGGFNGGGTTVVGVYGASGGGATDLRKSPGDITSRIAIAGGKRQEIMVVQVEHSLLVVVVVVRNLGAVEEEVDFTVEAVEGVHLTGRRVESMEVEEE
eukprot:gene28277-35113_t